MCAGIADSFTADEHNKVASQFICICYMSHTNVCFLPPVAWTGERHHIWADLFVVTVILTCWKYHTVPHYYWNRIKNMSMSYTVVCKSLASPGQIPHSVEFCEKKEIQPQQQTDIKKLDFLLILMWLGYFISRSLKKWKHIFKTKQLLGLSWVNWKNMLLTKLLFGPDIQSEVWDLIYTNVGLNSVYHRWTPVKFETA